MLAKVVGKNTLYCNPLYCYKGFSIQSSHEKTKIVQFKETLSLLPVSIKVHLISWLSDNLLDDINSCIKITHVTLFYSYCHNEQIIRWGHPLGLHRYRCKIPSCRKIFNNLSGTLLWRNYIIRIKWFSYLRIR
ncbi:MAG: IS1/IS1595 family N-terminal zinc-binding domain-containing protein [Arsenophonus sp. NEOnobi-MAG3]